MDPRAGTLPGAAARRARFRGREHEVVAPAVDVEVRAQNLQGLATHSMCQPAGPAPTEMAMRARPLADFQSAKSSGSSLRSSNVDPARRHPHEVVDVAVNECAVVGERSTSK